MRQYLICQQVSELHTSSQRSHYTVNSDAVVSSHVSGGRERFVLVVVLWQPLIFLL